MDLLPNYEEQCMQVAIGETDRIEVFRHKENDEYNYEDKPYCIFYAKAASPQQKRDYRIQKGVVGNNDSIYLIATRLPAEINPTDRIVYLGKIWTVTSVGYYVNKSGVVNRRIFNPEYIIKRSPKGITLE